MKIVQKITRKTIPRRRRQNYITNLRQDLIEDLKEYEKDPFSERKIELGKVSADR